MTVRFMQYNSRLYENKAILVFKIIISSSMKTKTKNVIVDNSKDKLDKY